MSNSNSTSSREKRYTPEALRTVEYRRGLVNFTRQETRRVMLLERPDLEAPLMAPMQPETATHVDATPIGDAALNLVEQIQRHDMSEQEYRILRARQQTEEARDELAA